MRAHALCLLPMRSGVPGVVSQEAFGAFRGLVHGMPATTPSSEWQRMLDKETSVMTYSAWRKNLPVRSLPAELCGAHADSATCFRRSASPSLALDHAWPPRPPSPRRIWAGLLGRAGGRAPRARPAQGLRGGRLGIWIER